MGAIIIIAVLGTFVAILAVVVVKSVLIPQHIEGIQKLLKQGKIQAAIKLGKTLVRKNPHDVEAHYFLAKSFLADKKDELALIELKFVNENAIFEQTIIMESEFRTEIASLYLKFKQPEDALKEFLLLIKLLPREAENYYQAGKLFEGRQKIEQAVGFYHQTLRLNPKHYKTHLALGMIYLRTKQNNEALKEFNTALEVKPDEFSLYFYLGRIYKETKNYPAAVASFEKSMRDPEFKQRAYIECGICYITIGNTDKAIDAFENAVKSSRNERSADTILARYSLAECYEKTRKIDKALAQWNAIAQVTDSYKNVAEKLVEYQDLQANDNMKEYLTSSSEEFKKIAENIVKQVFKLAAKDSQSTPYGCKITASESNQKVRQDLSLFYFFREPDPIGESVVRNLSEEIKSQNAKKAVACSSSGFDRQAIAFSEGRLIELYDRATLGTVLNKAGV